MRVKSMQNVSGAPALHTLSFRSHHNAAVPHIHDHLFQTNFLSSSPSLFFVFALPNASSHDHDIFLKLSLFLLFMLCLAGYTVGKMNRHPHLTRASVLVHYPRWQCWAPRLVWLSLVWFSVLSQLGPARSS